MRAVNVALVLCAASAIASTAVKVINADACSVFGCSSSAVIVAVNVPVASADNVITLTPDTPMFAFALSAVAPNA